jgi:hypothetical protein
MIPLHISYKGRREVAWQSCDTATDPDARGLGYFSQCIKALADSLEPQKIFFGFPNGNSIKGFKKLGWSEKAQIPTLCGLQPALINFGSGIRQVTSFESECDGFLNEYSSAGGTVVEKSTAYLNWRYTKSPKPLYSMFVINSGKSIDGVLVLRKVSTGSLSFTLIMEILALKKIARHKLLHFASNWGLRNLAWPVGVLQTDFSPAEGLFSGYIQVPHRFLPKRHVLMGMLAGANQTSDIFNAPWRVQTGDWDGF